MNGNVIKKQAMVATTKTICATIKQSNLLIRLRHFFDVILRKLLTFANVMVIRSTL